MSRIKIEDYGMWFDEETNLIFDDDGNCRSNIPFGTFPFNGKLYTYGTKVKIAQEYPYNDRSYIAVFQKDTEKKRILSYIYRTVSMKEAQEHYDGKPFELDDVFLEENGSKRRYLNTSNFKNEIIEIISPVYYKFPPQKQITTETPPALNGYRTIVNSMVKDPQYIRYKDHLYNCEVDTQGNVTDWYEPGTFGYGKYVYTIGTKVIIKHRSYGKSFYYVCCFDGSYFKFDGYPRGYPIGYSGISAGYFKSSRLPEGFSIVKIIEPHYYRPVPRTMNAWDKFKVNGGPKPVDTSFGTLIYIAVMVGGTIFKDRITLWIFATIIFLLWRFGYMNKK